MKKLLALVLWAALILGGCARIPSQVQANLTDPDSYRTCTGTLCAIDTVDGVTLKISFEDEETITAFLGGPPHPAAEPYWFGFEVVGDNEAALQVSGFYEQVPIGTAVIIRASEQIYMDSDYFYLAELSCNGVEYLAFEEGFHNICEYLSEN